MRDLSNFIINLDWLSALAIVGGYLFSIYIGHYFIKNQIVPLRKFSRGLPENEESDTTKSDFTASMVGYVERALFTTSVLIGEEEFIGLWVVLKIAGIWKGERKHNRSFLNEFYIGLGMSIAYGAIGGKFYEWGNIENWQKLAFSIFILVVFTWRLKKYSEKYIKK